MNLQLPASAEKTARKLPSEPETGRILPCLRKIILSMPAIMGFIIIIAALMPLAAYSQITLTISKSNNAPNPVASGQPFTYTLTYSWSGGAPGTLYIVDNVPSQLDVLSALPGNPVSVITGNQVTFSLSGLTLPSGSGTVQINARFKPGVTCGGVQACNRAGITTNPNSGSYVYSNDNCVTSATPTNKWTFEKEWITGCAVDDEVIFRIKIVNPAGSDIGGLNLTNVSLSDIIPSGAQLLSVTGSWTGNTGTTLTGGPTTLYVSPWTIWYVAYIKVKFPTPTFSVGQNVVNTAQMTFNTPCSPNMTTWSDTAKVTLCQGTTSGQLSKWLTLGLYFPSNPNWYPVFSPGCCGTYNLYYVNNGTLAQTNFVMEDDVPSKVDVNTIYTNVPSGNTPVTVEVYTWTTSCGTSPAASMTYNSAGWQSWSGLPSNICKIKWSYSGSISVSQYVNNYFDVCVRSTDYTNGSAVVTGQNIINTLKATATNLPTLTVTHTKTVDATQPKVIATKLFIGKCDNNCQVQPNGPFQPGDTVRFRMAVANIGNANATTCTITDNLPAGLSYAGNPTYYYGAFNWMANIYNPPCCSLSVAVPSQIGGTITTPALGATNLTWTFPLLPSRCDGLVEYFMIEFDVKISDNPPAPPGQYVNTFIFNAGNVPAVNSNQAYLTVNATAQLQAIKEVRKQGSGGAWASSASIPAGGIAEFGIRVKNTGNTPLTNLCLLDIMPFVGDIKVLPPYTSRGSLFDLPYNPANGAINITPTGFTAWYNSIGLIPSKNPSRTAVCGGFCGVADPAGATAGTFNTAPVQTYSFRISANTAVNLAPGGTMNAIVPVKVPQQGVSAGMNACNSFAVQAVPSGMPSVCLSAESNNACVTVAEEKPCFRILEERLNCVGKDANGNWVYQLAFNITNLSGVNGTLQVIPSTGSLVNLTPTNIPPGVPTNVHGAYISASTSGQVCFTIVLYGQGHEEKLCDSTVCLDIKPCPEPCPCPFQIDIGKSSAAQSSGNQVFISNNITVSTPVQKVMATIVSATVTQTCLFGGTTTYNSAATIASTTWNPITAIGIGTSEVTWTNMLCPTLSNQTLGMYINVPNAPGKGCKQVIKICIRLTITDCKCNTCDTLICFDIVRKWMPIILPNDDINILFPGKTGSGEKAGDVMLANDLPFARIIMTSPTKGTLTINNPADDEYTTGITLQSILLSSSPGIRAVAMKPDNAAWSDGVPSDSGILSIGVLEPGRSISFALDFENSELFRTWVNSLLIRYTVQDIPDTLSGIFRVTSRTPGTSGGDTLTEDASSAQVVKNARTFALRFLNENITKDSISSMILRVNKGSIIAIGPGLDKDQVTLSGYRTSGGDYRLLPGSPEGNTAIISAIPAGSDIGPIYITISADDMTSITLYYQTVSAQGDTITSGSIELVSPISGVKGGDEGSVQYNDIFLSEAQPNPAQNSVLIKFALENDESWIELYVTDTEGRQVAKLLEGRSIEAGKHEVVYNTGDLPEGVYFYTLRTATATQTRKLIIIR